jgi:Tfp pilus assembly protein PilO
MENEPQNQISDQRIILTLENIGRIGQHVLIIVTVCTVVFGPAWYAYIAQPLEDLKQRTAKLEASMDAQNKQINSIDKNLAILSERMGQANESLISIRKFMQREYEK